MTWMDTGNYNSSPHKHFRSSHICCVAKTWSEAEIFFSNVALRSSLAVVHDANTLPFLKVKYTQK